MSKRKKLTLDQIKTYLSRFSVPTNSSSYRKMTNTVMAWARRHGFRIIKSGLFNYVITTPDWVVKFPRIRYREDFYDDFWEIPRDRSIRSMRKSIELDYMRLAFENEHGYFPETHQVNRFFLVQERVSTNFKKAWLTLCDGETQRQLFQLTGVCDIHEENIGWRKKDGTLVIFDVNGDQG